ncbi:hypothetical protein Ato02nite_070950 [Paractinoplanes toevensis]|uniref:Uncharacterized protein n=1 Tax=Paractinoplanes toevensis TaxID=571911 RepID=A0A919TH88_9ACTN|nr:hypothetical protein Ato02nite_070950 [Actinoplanes toevensis]
MLLAPSGPAPPSGRTSGRWNRAKSEATSRSSLGGHPQLPATGADRAWAAVPTSPALSGTAPSDGRGRRRASDREEYAPFLEESIRRAHRDASGIDQNGGKNTRTSGLAKPKIISFRALRPALSVAGRLVYIGK